MSEKDYNELMVEDLIYDLLASMGIDPRLRGFRLLATCIKDYASGMEHGSAVTEYQRLAEKSRDPWINIQRAMRFATNKANAAIGEDGIAAMIGEAVSCKGKNNPITFAELCAKKIRRQLYDMRQGL